MTTLESGWGPRVRINSNTASHRISKARRASVTGLEIEMESGIDTMGGEREEGRDDVERIQDISTENGKKEMIN